MDSISKFLSTLFGEGKDLDTYQMCARAIVIFFIALMLIRVSGRRSFGQKTPFDNIIVITLGATLSRAIVGASPFLPIISTCLALSLLHRMFSWLVIHNNQVRKLAEGEKMVLFEKGAFDKTNMGKALVCEDDIRRSIREMALTENLDNVEKVYMETNGKITVIKRAQHQ